MGQSNAIDLAIKKGFPDKVVRNAKGFLNSQDEDLKIYIKDLINLKQLYEKKISKISEEKNEINLIKNEINEQIKYLISNKNQMINSIRDELLGRKKRAIKKLELELKKFTDKEDDLVTKESIKNIKKDILSKNLDDFDFVKNLNKENIKIGDYVELGELKLVGNVINEVDQNGDGDINVNGVRMKINISRAK